MFFRPGKQTGPFCVLEIAGLVTLFFDNNSAGTEVKF
jgi:hypothetical protein